MISIVKRYRHVVRDVDRHGRVRFYFRRKGHKKICLVGTPGTPHFDAAYQTALQATDGGALEPVRLGTPPRTYRWLCHRYFQSVDYKQLDPTTQRTRRLVLEHTWDEPISPGAKVLIGDCPIDRSARRSCAGTGVAARSTASASG